MIAIKKLSLLILPILILALSPVLFGQAVSGTLLGTINDPTGAAVSAARVIVIETATQTTHETVTNESGNFTLPNLPPGTYTITVEANGFKKDTHEGIDLLTNTSTRVDFALVTGSASETITVSTAPALLQTDRADISTTLEAHQISNLPLSSGNSFQSLLNTVPGMAPVVFNNSQFFNANNDLSVNANGQSSYVNLYQIEGIDDDQRTGIHIILVPPAAAIQNVDITTNNFEAEFGRAVGGVVNVTLKSGTNQFHGSVFQNMENNGVNARNYFSSGPNGRLVYNYTGASIGGPILKDKLFFFGDFLRTSDHESSTVNTNIPFYNVVGSNLDLSKYAGQVYDPKTGDTADCNGGPTPANCGKGRTPFAGNLIPLSRLSTPANDSNIGLTVLQSLDALARDPKTNLASAAYIAGAKTNNFSQNSPFSKDAISYDIKSDWTISQKDHLSGRFSHQKITTFQAPLFGSFLGGPAGGGFEATGTATAYSTGGNYDHVFSPTLFTEVRVGVAHLRNSAQQSDFGQDDAKKLGIPGTNLSSIDSGQVAFQVSNFAGNGENGTTNPLIGYSQSLPWLRAESNIDFANNWTKILGNHALKAGADIRRIRDDLLQGNINAAAGTFYFSENQTSTPGATKFNNATTGQANAIASILFDTPYQVGQDTNSTFPAYRQTWLFFFVADKWQATSKLTVDVGLRYELYPPATPRKAGGFSSYSPATNQLTIAGVAGNPSNIGMKTDYTNFAPRLGASFRATDSTVLRAGFGVSYVPFVDNTYAYNYPIKTSTDYTNIPTYGAAVLGSTNPAAVNFVSGIPPTPPVPVDANGKITATGNTFLNSLGNLYIPLNFKNAYVSSWNAAIQQALPHDSSLQIAYVANHGTRIDSSQNINVPSVYGESAAFDPLNIAFGKTASVTQFFLGYSSNYQSLQVQFTRRFTHGIAYSSAFTWGKAQNYVTTPQDGALLFYSGDRRRNYALADFDRRLNFSQTLTWELPAGRNHKYFNSGIGSYVLGGWKTSVILSAVSGLPFTLTTTSATPGTTQTVDQVAPFHVLHHHSNPSGTTQWFDPTSFSISRLTGCVSPGPCVVGNTQRNQFRGPGYFSDNLSLFKSFPIFRESSLEARFDAFNLTNTPAFGLPGTTYGSSSFGVITGTLGSGVGNVNGVGGPRVLQAAVKISF
ncbi:carboxypeptidase regulatory-like domain-containing protein [Tunturibacter empetritectus]|uniref:Carboxypeptidase regulatory-like domain-containing protein n=1 Tax=Tunturiibacter empetritectus TaxID=3069691 RepID=A0AAU7Z9X7_9BACT